MNTQPPIPQPLWDTVPPEVQAAILAVVDSLERRIAPGELLDKITILEIKAERIKDPDKLRNVRAELSILSEARERTISDSGGLPELTAELKAVNEALWQIEDEIRACECAGDFGPRFIELARSVYRQNDRRAAFKRRINERLGSQIIEEKSYTAPVPELGLSLRRRTHQ